MTDITDSIEYLDLTGKMRFAENFERTSIGYNVISDEVFDNDSTILNRNVRINVTEELVGLECEGMSATFYIYRERESGLVVGLDFDMTPFNLLSIDVDDFESKDEMRQVKRLLSCIKDYLAQIVDEQVH